MNVVLIKRQAVERLSYEEGLSAVLSQNKLSYRVRY